MDQANSNLTFQEGFQQGRAIASEKSHIFAKHRGFLLALNEEVSAAISPLVLSIDGLGLQESKHSIGIEVTQNSKAIATINPISGKSAKFRIWWSDPKMAEIAGLHHEDEIVDDINKLLGVLGKYIGLTISGAIVDPGN